MLERARGVEVASTSDEARVFLRRRDEQFVTADGGALTDEQLEARGQGGPPPASGASVPTSNPGAEVTNSGGALVPAAPAASEG